jgi:hypothetical protein
MGTGNQGVEITASAQINITGAADVIVNGTAGANTVEGVLITGGSVVGDNNAGNDATGFIILDANAGELEINNSTVRTSAPAASTRRILLSGNSIQLVGSTIQANSLGAGATRGQGEIVAAPDTGTVNISLGAGAAAGFALTDVELNQLEARIVRIGSADILTPGNTPLLTNQNGASVNGGTLSQPFATGTQSTITVTGAFTPDAEFAIDLFQLRTRDITNAAATDNIAINGNLNLQTTGAGRHFEAYAGLDITQGNSADVTTGSAADDKALVDIAVRDGDVHYRAERLINMTAGTSITTIDGEVTLSANQQVAATGGTFVGVTLTDADITTGVAAMNVGGDINILGRGGDVGNGNHGVSIETGSTVNSLGSGMTAGTITITGISRGITDNEGVELTDVGTRINSIDGNILITGTSTATGERNEGIEVGDDVQINSTGTGTGAATITLNGTGSGTNNSEGVQVEDRAQINSIDGNIVITGRSTGTGSGNEGVEISTAVVISSTGTGANAATITLNGTGGTGDDNNDGVEIDGMNTLIRSVAGNITINGTAGSNMTAGSNQNRGVQISGAANVSSTGTDDAANGRTAGTITINGTGGAGEDLNDGVFITGGMTQVISVDGDITIDGTGQQTNNAGSEDNNRGVVINAGAAVSSTGIDTNDAAMRTAANITISGTGANGDLNNDGVEIDGAMTVVTTIDGNIRIAGTGGSNTNAGSNQNRGVQISGAAIVSSTGTDDAANGRTAGTITIDGTGGAGEDNNDGVLITGPMTQVISIDGDITIDGTGQRTANGGVTEDSNRGVQIDTGALISSTGTNTNDPAMRTAALITISGTGAAGDDNNDGIEIGGANARVNTIDGNITIIGTGGSNGSNGDDNNGVRIDTGTAAVTSNGTGTITIDGTGGAGDDNNRGVFITANGTQVTAGGANITITGTGGSNAAADSDTNEGVRIDSGAAVTNTAAGAITVSGTGGGGEDDNNGVFITGPNTTQITTVDGNITVSGTGGTNGSADSDDSNGVLIDRGSVLQATGAGSINIAGTGGAADDRNQGINIHGVGTLLAAVTGNITLTGTGGTRGGFTSDSEGVDIEAGAVVRTTGMGMNVGNITINGTGNGFDENEGAAVEDMGTQVTTVDGDITIIGTSNGTGDNNVGVQIEEGAIVATTGVGANAGNITLSGTGSGTFSSEGVQIQDMGTVVSTAMGDGTISITGTTTATTANNEGVEIEDGAVVSSNTGTLTIVGTSSGTNSNEGVQIESAGTLVTSVTGNIRITGNGNGSGTGNEGVEIEDGAVVSSTGVGAAAATITINGTGGNGTDDNDGVEITDVGTMIISIDGDITIDGTGRGTGSNNNGVEISDGALVRSSGTTNNAATVNINGAGGGNGSNNKGVGIDNGTVISAAGNLTITGSGTTGGGVGSVNDGVTIFNGSTIQVGGAGTLTIDGEAGTGDDDNVGISVENVGTVVQTANGTLTLDGRSVNSAGDTNVGVGIDEAIVRSQGSGNIVINGRADSTDGGDMAAGVAIVEQGLVSAAGGNILISGQTDSSGQNNAGVVVITGGSITGVNATSITINGFDSEMTNPDVGVLVGGTSLLSTVSGNITVNAAERSNVNGNLTMQSGARILSVSGDVSLNSTNDVFISHINAGTGSVFVTADVAVDPLLFSDADGNPINIARNNLGAIIDNNNVDVDPNNPAFNPLALNIIGAAASLDAAEGIGGGTTTADPLDIDTSVGTLAVLNTSAGSVNVTNFSGALLTLDTVGAIVGVINDAPGTDITVTNNSPLTIGPAGVTNNNGGNITVTAANAGDLNIFGPVAVNDAAGNITLFGADSVSVNNSVVGPDVSTVGANSVIQITAMNNNVIINNNASVETTGAGSMIAFNAGSDANLGMNAQVRSVGQVDIDSAANVNLGDNSLVETTGAGSVVNIMAAAGNVTLQKSAQVLSQTDINISASQDVNFNPNVTIRSFGFGGIIDINAIEGNVTGDFVNPGSTTLIQTAAGTAVRGKPVINIGSIDVPQIDIFGQTSLTVDVGVVGETNLLVTIDWGDATPLQLGQEGNPADQRSTTYVVNAGINTFFHLYFANPSANQADPIPINFDVEHNASIRVDGFINPVINPVLFDFTIDSADTLARTPGTGFGATVFEFESNAPALSFPETTATIGLDNLSETSTLEETSNSAQATASESATAQDERFELRLILRSGKKEPFALDNDILEGDNIKRLWKRLPDGRYEIVLIRKNIKRVVLTVDVRGGRAFNRSEAPSNQPDANDNKNDQPQQQNGNGAGDAKQKNDDETSSETSRVDEQSLPLSQPSDNTKPVDAAVTLPTAAESATMTERQRELDEELIRTQVDSDSAEARPAISAVALVGSAIAYRSLRRGSSAHGSWEERVEQALESSGERPLGRAARLRRQLLRS